MSFAVLYWVKSIFQLKVRQQRGIFLLRGIFKVQLLNLYHIAFDAFDFLEFFDNKFSQVFKADKG